MDTHHTYLMNMHQLPDKPPGQLLRNEIDLVLSKDLYVVVSFNVWTINCSKYVKSRYGMSFLIIKGIEYYIFRSFTLVILELLPQTLRHF